MPRPSHTIALVACASRKRGQAAPAADLYVSDLFRKARAYADRHADAWFILSAKHGLVDPAEDLEPYDLTLNDLGVEDRRAWAQRVWRRLESIVASGDTVVFLAGAKYREGLASRLEQSGVRVEVPMEGLRIGEQLAWLNRGEVFSGPSTPGVTMLDAFYATLERLIELHGADRLRTMARRRDLPERGVYFVLDRNEPRTSTPDRARVVRVGSQALKRGAAATLVTRLRQHLGPQHGAGSHRSSIFRLHVGTALAVRDGLEVPTWGASASPIGEERARELELERRVSRYVGDLDVVVLPVLDEPGPDSIRAYVRRNAIALLSVVGSVIDPPSAAWLGRHAARPPVRASGLWNVRHVGDAVDGDFVPRFAELVEGLSAVTAVVPRPTVGARAEFKDLQGRLEGPGFRPASDGDTTPDGRPTAAAFRRVLREVLEEATQSGADFIDVTGGDLHRRVGGYPAPSPAMATCCSVMRSAMKSGDAVLAAPPKGVGASLKIRYAFPR